MAKSCYFCDKQTKAGGKRKHNYGGGWEFRAKHITRKFKPNLRSINIDDHGKKIKVDICMKCYKRLKSNISK